MAKTHPVCEKPNAESPGEEAEEYVVADPTVIGTIDAIEEAVRDTERLAGAIIWKLKGPQAQAITSGTPDCDNIEYRLGAIHSALHSINRDLYDSAHTIGA
jgi:hypothetical protein